MIPISLPPEDRTPDSQVAYLITQELLGEDLIAQSQLNRVLSGLVNGSLKANDWKSIAASALELEAHHGKAAY